MPRIHFGPRIRDPRKQQGLTQHELADRVGVSVSFISNVENERLHFGDYPTDKFIHKLAVELSADEDELLLRTDQVPTSLRQRIRQRPEALKFADLDHKSMEALLSKLGNKPK